MLEDRVRCQLYQRAIEEIVKPKHVVCDIGTGSGLLAFFAIQAGAEKVYAIERTDIIKDAERVAKENGWDDRIVFIKKDSSKVILPEKVDVIVSELIGHFALEEDLLRYVIDAKKRFLKKRGILIPSFIEMFLAPIEAPGIYRREIDFWSKKIYGINFSFAKEEAVNRRYIKMLNSRNLLASPRKIHSLNFYKMNDSRNLYVNKSSKFIVVRKGCFHGFAGWFRARLFPNVLLSTSPKSKPTHWKNSFFPIQEPLPANKGDVLKVRLAAYPMFGQIIWSWTVEAKKILFKHSTLRGIPISKRILKKTILKD